MSRKLLETIFGFPAELIEKSIEVSKRTEKKLLQEKPVKKMARYWHTLGPGLTAGASDDDPSGIATYSQTGAQYGLQLLWLSSFTFPLMAMVQEMCARIGIVTGQGLAANIRKHYPRSVLYACAVLLLAANSFNIGADLGAMAQSVQLIIPGLSFFFLVAFFAIGSILLQIFMPYSRYAEFLKYLALVLFAYIFTAFCIQLDWKDIAIHTVIPAFSFTKNQIFLVCGILGTTISPYLFFWQTSQEVEEKILHGQITLKLRRAKTSKRAIQNMRTDVWTGMFISNAVMFFIIAVCAGTLFKNGITNIGTAADAAAALRPFAGSYASLLFAIGVIGVGILAIPILAGSASYALSESFGWKQGLYRKLKEAYAFYGVIIVSMLIGLSLNFIGLDPIKALIYSAVANGIIAPIILFLIVRMSGNEKIMGEWKNKPLTKTIGWIATGLMTVAGVATIVAMIS
jgi:NRAMP (natural resistance-associated macrophage protein)-like metal ion transporter